MEQLKGNSHVEREAEESSDVKKPVTTNVVVKKAKRFGGKFFAEDAKTVGGHVVDSILIPSAQKLLSDVVKGAIDWLIYGSKGNKPIAGPGQVSYTKYYTGGVGATTPTYGGNPMISRANTVYAVNDVMFNDVSEAEEVLLRMNELVAKYQMVSVADFYDLIGQKGAYTDTKYGWRDLRGAEVVRNYTGWSIRFPPAKPLE